MWVNDQRLLENQPCYVGHGEFSAIYFSITDDTIIERTALSSCLPLTVTTTTTTATTTTTTSATTIPTATLEKAYSTKYDKQSHTVVK